MEEPVKPFFPAQPTKEQNERLRSNDRLDIRGDVSSMG
jgi:hypothetical protein